MRISRIFGSCKSLEMYSTSCDVIMLADKNAHTDTCINISEDTWTQTQTRTLTLTQKHSVTHLDIMRRPKKQRTITITRSSLAHQPKYKHTYTQQRVCHMSVPSSSNNVADICATRSLFHCHNFYALLSFNVSTHRVDASRLTQNHGVTQKDLQTGSTTTPGCATLDRPRTKLYNDGLTLCTAACCCDRR